jgi:hypothetical protein
MFFIFFFFYVKLIPTDECESGQRILCKLVKIKLVNSGAMIKYCNTFFFFTYCIHIQISLVLENLNLKSIDAIGSKSALNHLSGTIFYGYHYKPTRFFYSWV